ncbi:Rv3654c family TadE-like protein [Rothia kristinae]
MTGRTPPHRIPRPRRAPGPRRWAAPELLRSGRERGASTVAMIGVIAVIGVLLAAVCLLGHVALCTHRAATAADLAALAAADTARGLRPGVACDEAERTARDNRARLVSCAPAPEDPEIMDVRVAVDLAVGARLLGPAYGVARAGPPPSGSAGSGS